MAAPMSYDTIKFNGNILNNLRLQVTKPFFYSSVTQLEFAACSTCSDFHLEQNFALFVSSLHE